MASDASAPKVVHIITGLETGGAENMLWKLVSAGSAQLAAVVISLGGHGTFGEKFERIRVPVYTLGMRRGALNPVAIVRLRRLVRALRPILVQGWMYHGNLAATLATAALRPTVPLLWNVRQSLYDLRKEKRLTRSVIRVSAVLSGRPIGIVYNSRASATQHEAFGFARERTQVIPNGFDLSLYRPDLTARAELKRQLGLANSAVLVGMVGRYHPMKNHAGFLCAMARIDRSTGHRILLVGKGLDEQNHELHELVRTFGLMDSVRFLGERADMPRLMPAFDVVCSASSWGEGFPNVVGEAMACGVPCVVTDVGDAADVVGSTGKVVAPGDPEALARALRQLIEMDPESRQRLGAAARERIAKYFSIEHVARQYEALYAETLSGVRNRRTI